MIILIADTQLRLFYLLHFDLAEFVNGFLCQKETDLIALAELLCSVTFFPVHRDILLPHHLLEEALPC